LTFNTVAWGNKWKSAMKGGFFLQRNGSGAVARQESNHKYFRAISCQVHPISGRAAVRWRFGVALFSYA